MKALTISSFKLRITIKGIDIATINDSNTKHSFPSVKRKMNKKTIEIPTHMKSSIGA